MKTGKFRFLLYKIFDKKKYLEATYELACKNADLMLQNIESMSYNTKYEYENYIGDLKQLKFEYDNKDYRSTFGKSIKEINRIRLQYNMLTRFYNEFEKFNYWRSK
jgi:hypothetical protein